jgi:predicted site-specific integrase-resolvase
VSPDTPPPVDSPATAPRWWRPSSLARRTGLCLRTIERYCSRGMIADAERSPGGHWRIPEASAEAFLAQLRVKPAA